MRTISRGRSGFISGLAVLSFAGLLAVMPARAVTYYQHRLALDVDALAYDANPGDYTWDVDDWAQTADLIPGNKGDGTNGPPVQITINDPIHGLTNIPFTVGPTTDGFNNAMLAYGQTIPVVPGHYQGISMLYDQDCGPINHPIIFHYADGDDAQTVAFQDWCYKQSPTDFYAWKATRAEKKTGIDMGTQCGVDYKYLPLDPSRMLKSITFGKAPSVFAPGDKDTGGPDMILFSMTLVSPDAGLPAYGTITGTIKDAGGAAVADADVFIPELGLKARGDQTGGSYTMQVPAGTYNLTAIKEGDPLPGVQPVQVAVTAGGTATQNLVLGSPLKGFFGEVKGTVQDSSKMPVAGATVKAVSTLGATIKSVTTDATGAFDFTGLLPGSVTIASDAPLADLASNASVTVVSGQTATVTLPLSILPSINLASSALPAGIAWHGQGQNTGATVDGKSLAPADPAYKEDTTWINTVVVPGDANMDVSGSNAYFWYRLSGLTLPAAMQALKDKNVPLVLKGFQIAGSPTIDRNASDKTFFNGHLIGSTSNAGDENAESTLRTYAIDPSFVNWTGPNTISMLVYTGGVPAGISGSGPTLLPLSSKQTLISGQILDTATGKPSAVNSKITLSHPGTSQAFLTTRGTGSYSILGVAPGAYVLGIPASATVAQGATANITPAGGQVTRQDLMVSTPPFFEGIAPDPHDDTFAGTTLDAKWTDADLGMPMGTGTAALTGGHLVQQGAGGGFNTGAGESMNFLSQKITGDFAATVQVIGGADLQNGAGAGLMLRESTAPQDPYVAARATGAMVDAPYRLAAASLSRGINGAVPAVTPVWLKVRRVGNETATFYSTDGMTAIPVAVEATDIPADALIGPFVTSGADPALAAITFATFKVVPVSATPAPPQLILGDPLKLGKIGIGDATFVLQVVVKLKTPTNDQFIASDVDKDGAITIKDVTKILQAIVNGTSFQ